MIWDNFFDNNYVDYDFKMVKDLTQGQIFDHLDFPFYLEPHREEFYQHFMIHFKYERIGYPTLEEFRDHLQDIMITNSIKYKFYYQAQQKAKSLKWWNNKDYESTVTRTLQSRNEGTSNSTSSGTSTSEYDGTSNTIDSSTTKVSDVPEGRIDDIDRYLTSAQKDNGDSNTQTHDESSATSSDKSESRNQNTGNEQESIRTVEGGNIGVTSSGELVQSWLKDGLIEVDKMILKDLEVLFMQVY